MEWLPAFPWNPQFERGWRPVQQPSGDPFLASGTCLNASARPSLPVASGETPVRVMSLRDMSPCTATFWVGEATAGASGQRLPAWLRVWVDCEVSAPPSCLSWGQHAARRGTEQGMEQAACESPHPGVEAAGPPLSLSPGSAGGPRSADLCSPGSYKRPRTRSSGVSQRPGSSRRMSVPGARLEQSQPSGKRSLGETVQCWMSLPLSRNTYSFLLSWKTSLKPTD